MEERTRKRAKESRKPKEAAEAGEVKSQKSWWLKTTRKEQASSEAEESRTVNQRAGTVVVRPFLFLQCKG